MARVFLADCQPLFNEALEALITRDGSNEVVGQASTAPQIMGAVGQLKPELFVLDAGLALGHQPSLVETILGELPDTKVILLAQDTDMTRPRHDIEESDLGLGRGEGGGKGGLR